MLEGAAVFVEDMFVGFLGCCCVVVRLVGWLLLIWWRWFEVC